MSPEEIDHGAAILAQVRSTAAWAQHPQRGDRQLRRGQSPSPAPTLQLLADKFQYRRQLIDDFKLKRLERDQLTLDLDSVRFMMNDVYERKVSARPEVVGHLFESQELTD